MKRYKLVSSAQFQKYRTEQELTDAVVAANSFIKVLREYVEGRVASLDREISSKSIYESPQFAYKLSDLLGSKREMEALLSQLEEVDHTDE